MNKRIMQRRKQEKIKSIKHKTEAIGCENEARKVTIKLTRQREKSNEEENAGEIEE